MDGRRSKFDGAGDEIEKIGAIIGEAFRGDFPGKGGDDFRVDGAGWVFGKPLCEGANESGEASVVRGLCSGVVMDADRRGWRCISRPDESAEFLVGAAWLDFESDESGRVCGKLRGKGRLC